MKSLSQVIILSLFAVLASCTSKEAKIVKDFPINENLKGERVDLELAEYIANIMEPAGDFYVFNAIRSGYCFQVYDENFNLVDTIVREGNGPAEIVGGALYLGQWSGQNSSPEILAYGSDTKKLYQIPLSHPEGISVKQSFEDSKDMQPKFVYKGDGPMYYGISLGYTNDGGLFSFDANTGVSKLATPAYDFDPSKNPLFYATQQSMALDLSHKHIATAYMNYPCVAIYDTSLNLVNKYDIDKQISTESASGSEEFPELINIKYHGGNIVVLYSPVGSDINYLRIFDESGTPIASYGVGNAIWYVIDDAHQRLLTVHYDKDQDVIYLMKYKLPKALTTK